MREKQIQYKQNEIKKANIVQVSFFYFFINFFFFKEKNQTSKHN